MTHAETNLNAAKALFLEAVTYQEDGHFPQAEILLRRAHELAPERESILANLSSVLLAQQRPDAAEEFARKLIAQNPGTHQGWFALGLCRFAKNDYLTALECFDTALKKGHDAVAVRANQGKALAAQERFAEALHSYECALAIDPDDLTALNGRGSLLTRLGRPAEAVQCYDRALRYSPREAEIHLNRGNALIDMNRLDEAIASFNTALEIKPALSKARWSLGIATLSKGDFDTGWKNFEARWDDASVCGGVSFPDKPWLGVENLHNKILLLHSEQGLGDTIQFCRFVGQAAAKAGKVILRVQEPLKNLLMGLPRVHTVISDKQPIPYHDYRCPLMSLPLALGVTMERLSDTNSPYIPVPPQRRAKWGNLLEGTKGLKVGLAWSGNARQANDHNRSMPLSALAPLLDCGATFFVLQKDIREPDRQYLETKTAIKNYTAHEEDFRDTAAMIEQLDLVIAVCTSVAHLAGAVGTELWIPLCYAPDWRWCLERTDSPWYPSARLFRQTSPGDWGSVIQQISQELQTRL